MNRRGGHARTPLAIAILFLLALVPFALYRGSQVPEAEAAWWNPSWQYRQSIAVTNNTTEQTNVYLSVSLDTSDTTKFQADCGDLRFTKQNGQLLPYYVVSGCGTASTSVHVQLDIFPAGEQTLYVYYGNSFADNGFSSNDFLTEATNYTVGGTGSEETGPGAAAYWKLDEGSGSTTKDSINQLTGTIYTQTASWATEDQCVSGKCIYFNGVESAWNTIRVPDNLKLDGNLSSTSVSVWVKIAEQKNHQLLYKRNTNGTPGWLSYVLGVNSNNKPYFQIANTNGTSVTATSDSAIELNTWYQLIGVYNGSNIQIYIDSSASIANPPSQTGDVLDTNLNLQIGGLDGTSITKGFIDEVKIFPYALTEDQIKTEYNLGSAVVMGTGPTVAPPANGTLSDSLVAHWAFDEQYGQTAHDKVGNNHGTFGADTNPGSDDPTWKPAGDCKVNGCVGFDGGDHVNMISSIALKTTYISFSAWVKSGDVSVQKSIINKHTSPSAGWWVRQLSNGTIRFLVTTSTGIQYLTTSQALVSDTWYHLSGTYDGTSVKVYVNGQLASGTTTSPENTGDIVTSDASVKIGAQWSSGENFIGSIDEVKIYNTALTADQIKQDMNAGASVAYSVGSEEADELADGAGAPPIAEWKFDEKTGTTAGDTSGNGLNSNAFAGSPTWTTGKIGPALNFQSAGDYLSVSDNTLLKPSNITVESWVYPTTNFVNYAAIMTKSTTGAWGDGYGLVKSGSGNNIRFFVNNYNSGSSGDATLSLNTWSHVVGTYDGTTVNIYVNGVLIDSSNYSTTLSNSTKPLLIGRGEGSINYRWIGKIDHVKIYDYARTPAQIAYDYNRGAPVAHWKFDECEGTVAHDASGNENHGTINIGATGTQTTAGTCSTSGAWANGASGKFEGSLSFDGTDDYVSVPDDPLLDITGELTVSSWVKINSIKSTNYGGVGKYANISPFLAQRAYGFVFRANTTIVDVWLSNNGSSATGMSGNTALDLGNWHLVTFTYKPSTYTRLYVDGKLDAEATSNVPTSLHNSSAPVWIGTNFDNTSSGRYSDAVYDDVRIYNYALSLSQIQKVYNQGLGVRYGN